MNLLTFFSNPSTVGKPFSLIVNGHSSLWRSTNWNNHTSNLPCNGGLSDYLQPLNILPNRVAFLVFIGEGIIKNTTKIFNQFLGMLWAPIVPLQQPRYRCKFFMLSCRQSIIVISLMQIRNDVGPTTLPCRIPLVTSDYVSFMSSCLVLAIPWLILKSGWEHNA